jgi:hypothetical protein
MLPSMIQTHFLDRISNTHGEPPKDTEWATDLSVRLEGVDATAEQLNRAADSLVETIKSKSFPPFSVCLKAIRDAVQDRYAKGGHIGAVEGITSENYSHHVQKWRGRFGNDYLVLSRNQAAEWETWREYFRIKAEFDPKFGFDYEALSNPAKQDWTVPTPWPDMFDRSAPMPLTGEAVRRARTPAGTFRTEAMIAKTKAELERFHRDVPSRRREERVKRQHIDEGAFDRWAEETRASPTPSPSSQLVSRMNPQQFRDAAE